MIHVLLVLLACAALEDADRDGSPSSKDCDDTDPARSPQYLELPYNGIDDDCNGLDLLDCDHDGFPGISMSDYLTAFPDAKWHEPNAIADCDDGNAAVNPFADDPLYDGLDANCDGLKDYDGDLDGYCPPEYASLDSLNPSGDCDDTDFFIHPGARDEDGNGVDEDCDGCDGQCP